jgi:hypothetical protein
MGAQNRLDEDTMLFPVRLVYHVHGNIACCTLTVQHTQAKDLVGLSIYNESPALRRARVAEFKALLNEMKAGQHCSPQWFSRVMTSFPSLTQWASYDAASGSHQCPIGLGDFFRLHLEIIRARHTLAEADIVCLQGSLHVIESTRRGLTLSIEREPLDSRVAEMIHLYMLLAEIDYE